jgi:lipid-A-disaccharide synthase
MPQKFGAMPTLALFLTKPHKNPTMLPMKQTQPTKIFFSIAEASGDRHASKVIHRLVSEDSDLVCVGFGGPEMAKAGCKLLENTVDKSAMLLYVFSKIGAYIRRLKRVRAYLKQNRPEVVVLVDSFAWNIHVARAAKKLNIPVIYYVAPQLWAWALWRIAKLRKTATQIACILPFEQQWFQARGLKTTYVGHPLFDDPQATQVPSQPSAAIGLTIALFPGSRSHEIDKLWEPMQNIARKIQKAYPDARFVSTGANPETIELMREQADPQLGIEIRPGSIRDITSQTDLALVASGTATLEVAAQNCPMIVIYHVHPLQWHLLGRWLITTKYLSLVNILANKELVPEFMRFHHNTEPITQKALELLGDDKKRKEMQLALGKLMESLIRPGASQAVAEIILSYLPVN